METGAEVCSCVIGLSWLLRIAIFCVGAQMEASTLFCPARPISLMQTSFQDWMWSSVSRSEVEREGSHAGLETLSTWLRAGGKIAEFPVAVNLSSEIGNGAWALPLAVGNVCVSP